MTDNTARDRFRAAYENRYTWDSSFPGYTTKTNDLKAKREFKESYEKLGNYYVPKHQVIESIDPNESKITTEFTFSETKLVEPATVA